jgi:hypothetical protein
MDGAHKQKKKTRNAELYNSYNPFEQSFINFSHSNTLFHPFLTSSARAQKWVQFQIFKPILCALYGLLEDNTQNCTKVNFKPAGRQGDVSNSKDGNKTWTETKKYELQLIRQCLGFEVLTPVVMKSAIFWDIMSCSPLGQPTTRRYIPEDGTLDKTITDRFLWKLVTDQWVRTFWYFNAVSAFRYCW